MQDERMSSITRTFIWTSVAITRERHATLETNWRRMRFRSARRARFFRKTLVLSFRVTLFARILNNRDRFLE